MSGRTYEQGETYSIHWAISWLHARADEMNDPYAKAILNTVAFNMGTARNRTALSPSPLPDEVVRGLMLALTPFAEAADHFDPPENDDHIEVFLVRFNFGQLRRAREALAAARAAGYKEE